jgi:hypothetical protein
MHSVARVYCANDEAYLCGACDEVHHAGPLASKHQRQVLKEACSLDDDLRFSGISGSSGLDAVVPQLMDEERKMEDGGFSYEDVFSYGGVNLDDDVLFGGVAVGGEGGHGLMDEEDLFASLLVPGNEDAGALEGRLVSTTMPQATMELLPSTMMRSGAVQEEGMALMVPQTVPTINVPEAGEGMPDYIHDVAHVISVDSEDEFDDDHNAYEDPDDVDFYISAPRSSRRSRRRAHPASHSPGARRALVSQNSGQPVDLSCQPQLTRKERVARYLAKRARRSFQKTIRYQSRKAYAEIRPRIKGRFVSHEEYAEYMSAKKRQEEDAVVPAC